MDAFDPSRDVRVLREPTVYLVGRQVVDPADIDRFLADHGVSWQPDKTLRRKLARQAARSVLPNATETKIFVSANARALRHFIEMRASRHAEVEIRKLAVKVLEVMQAEAPALFGDYRLEPLPDGTFEVSTPHRKV